MRPGGRLTRRVGLARGTGGTLKRAPIKHKPRKRRPTELGQHEARLQAIFHSVVAERGECANCGYDGPFLEAHHAIGKQLLKRLLLQKGKPCPPEVIWDRRNAVVLCQAPAQPVWSHSPDQEPQANRCHSRHTLAFRRAGRKVLRPENWQFAHEHGLEWVLETEYPERKEAA